MTFIAAHSVLFLIRFKTLLPLVMAGVISNLLVLCMLNAIFNCQVQVNVTMKLLGNTDSLCVIILSYRNMVYRKC